MLRIMQVDPSMEISFRHYQLSLKQMFFAGHPAYIINRKRSNYFPFVILKDDEIIGAFALERGAILSVMDAPKTAIYLRGLSLDSRHQGKGYFRKVLQELERYIKEQDPDITDLYLMVNVNNDNGYYAFIKSGFIDRQKTVKQSLVTLKVLSKSL
ncbi:GNAT family N-acetyltransferase [Macrococcus equipercicus]|uniref:GNAT family N-acetyltransferase n=1 Tax=Macrococcus equipercicus TaxID=69967 RepID=A0A9Q9BMI6_9STAP|nr:GNAT family N-acetyltransferase [Macrococcus equipercicus]UTH14283.1 GNAT family N-acetyltransferase [Macrococcus equipercicus]